MPTVIEVLRKHKHFEKVERVRNAVKGLPVIVTPEISQRGKPGSPAQCAFALALPSPGLAFRAFVFLVNKSGKEAVRYRTSQKMRDAIGPFDQSKGSVKVPAGTYMLLKPSNAWNPEKVRSAGKKVPQRGVRTDPQPLSVRIFG